MVLLARCTGVHRSADCLHLFCTAVYKPVLLDFFPVLQLALDEDGYIVTKPGTTQTSVEGKCKQRWSEAGEQLTATCLCTSSKCQAVQVHRVQMEQDSARHRCCCHLAAAPWQTSSGIGYQYA
jgi:hypothetical protein